MVLPIAEGRRYAIDSAQGTPFIDFLGFHCVLKRTVLGRTRCRKIRIMSGLETSIFL
jgi:hypothetical protein